MEGIAAAPPLPDGVVRERIDLAGGEVSVLRGGEGPPLLYLHASGGSGIWMPAHAHLAERFEVVAPDHPGFGGSDDFPELDDVEDLAFHYGELIEALGLASPAVLGTSFGGWIAAELAAYLPASVGRLLLVDPIGLYLEGEPIADLFMMSPPQMLATLFANPEVAAGLFPAEPDLDFILAMAKDEAAFARFAWAPFCHDPKLPRRLGRVTAPTLVLWGEGDAVVSTAHGERYAELIPDARLELVTGCGHAVAMEKPDELAERAFGFLLDGAEAR